MSSDQLLYSSYLAPAVEARERTAARRGKAEGKAEAVLSILERRLGPRLFVARCLGWMPSAWTRCSLPRSTCPTSHRCRIWWRPDDARSTALGTPRDERCAASGVA